MSKNDDWRNKRNDYSMYALFSTDRRAEKKQQKKQAQRTSSPLTQHEESTNSTNKAHRVSRSVSNGENDTYGVWNTKKTYHRPSGADHGSGTVTFRAPRGAVSYAVPRSKNTAAQHATEKSVADTTKANDKTIERERYTVRRARRTPHRPQADKRASVRAKNRNEALFLVETNGEKVLMRNASLTEMRAVRVPPNIQIKTYKNPKISPAPISFIVMAAVITLMILALISSYVQLNEQTRALSDAEEELETLNTRVSDLQLQIVQRSDLVQIESEAQEMGMVKNDTLPREYVALEGHDHARVVEEENEESDQEVSVQTVILPDPAS